MTRRRDKTTAELMAEENAEQAAAGEAFEAWREVAFAAAHWPEVPAEAVQWLHEREPDAERAGLVLLAWNMGAQWPAAARQGEDAR